MIREELTTIIGLLEKVEDKRLAWGTMWDEERGVWMCARCNLPESPMGWAMHPGVQ